LEINNFQISRNFNLKEFECPCCNRVKISSRMVAMLEKLRNMIGSRPIIITSGYRCKDQNSIVGGEKNSYHKYGLACDIKVEEMNPEDLAKYSKGIGFKGIGIYQTFIHLDLRNEIYFWKK